MNGFSRKGGGGKAKRSRRLMDQNNIQATVTGIGFSPTSPTNDALLINFRLNSDEEILLIVD